MAVQRAKRIVRYRRQRRRLVDGEGAVAQPASEHVRDTRYPSGGPAVRIEPGRPAGRQAALQAHGEVVVHATGTGEPQMAAPGFANSTRIQGRTDADFAGSTYEVTDATSGPAKGCKGCGPADCKRVTGEVVMTFAVATTVTLPTPDPDLTPCQLARVRKAIRDILAPHEQQHVAAFHTYDGSLTRKFDLTMCEEHFDAAIKAMFDKAEQPRRARAQASSDKLDQPPFFFDVDIDCREPLKRGKRASNNPTDESPDAERPA